MRHPLKSLLVAIALLLLGSMFLSPVTPSRMRVSIGPSGERRMRQKTDAEMKQAQLQVLRINLPAYVCFTGAGVSFGWTLFLVAWGTVNLVRLKFQHGNHENVD